MTVREYIGARYVPLFMGTWDNTSTYEPLSIVQYQGNSYTSRQYVPAGIEITNETYWAETGSYNAQVEQYRQEVLNFDSRIDDVEDSVTSINGSITELNSIIPKTEFTSENTVKNYIDNRMDNINSSIEAVENIIPSSEFTSINTVKKYIDDEITELNTELSEKIDNIVIDAYSEVNFTCVDRFIPGIYGSDETHTVQCGCVFEQDDILYYAQIIEATNQANDRLIIRNLNSETTVADVVMNLGHGYSISYNPNNKMLLTSASNQNNNIILISVETISNPIIYNTITITFLTDYTNYNFCWIDNNIMGLNIRTNEVIVFDVNKEIITEKTFNLSDGAYHESGYTFQSIQYFKETNEVYIGTTSPDGCIIVDWETGNQKNYIQCAPNYGFIYMVEVEMACRVGNELYISNVEYVDTRVVISLLKWDMKNGTIGIENSPFLRNHEGIINAYIDYESGALNPKDLSDSFKLAGDFIKYTRAVGFDGVVRCLFKNDYPLVIYVSSEKVLIDVPGNVSSVYIEGINAINGWVKINNSNKITLGQSQTSTLANNTYYCGIIANQGEVIIDTPAVPTINDKTQHHVLIFAASATIRLQNAAQSDNLRLATTQCLITCLSATNITNDFQYRNIVLENTV